MKEFELPAVRHAVARIRDEYEVVRQEQPQATAWEAFLIAKQRHNAEIIAANTAVELARAARLYRTVKLGTYVLERQHAQGAWWLPRRRWSRSC
jgi:hypothetical protein